MLITLARKPMGAPTVQGCVNHGCGAINIDACRVGGPLPDRHVQPGSSRVHSMAGSHNGSIRREFWSDGSKGRWPANLILCGETVQGGFPQVTTHGGGTSSTGFWSRDDRKQVIVSGDSGSAARFFKQVGGKDGKA